MIRSLQFHSAEIPFQNVDENARAIVEKSEEEVNLFTRGKNSLRKWRGSFFLRARLIDLQRAKRKQPLDSYGKDEEIVRLQKETVGVFEEISVLFTK